jgi:sulfur carrier protein ThiS
MLTVNVFLHSILQKKSPQGLQRRVEATLEDDATIIDLIRHLEIDYEPEDLLLALNGRVAELDQVLVDGDKVHLMLPISGGVVWREAGS